MGVEKEPLGVKLFMAVTFRKSTTVESVLELLAHSYGTPERFYGSVPFIWSDYYSEEMGQELEKYYAIFPVPIKRDNLDSIKNSTNRLENDWAIDGRRTINLDPGYLARDKLVLASTKDFFHRIYLGAGIYGEVTLHYRKGVFRHFSWTYPDYKDPQFLEFLYAARAQLVFEHRNEEQR